MNPILIRLMVGIWNGLIENTDLIEVTFFQK